MLNLKLNLARLLLSKQIAKVKIRVLMNFLRYYVRFENQEINVKFEQEISNLTERSNIMGLEELLLDRAEKRGVEKGFEKGIERGIEKNTRETALKMKKSGIALALIASITGLPVEEIEKLV